MDKLEQKIFDAWKGQIPDYMFSYYGDSLEEASRIAAKICLEVAEKSYCAGWECLSEISILGSADPKKSYEKGFEDFKKEIL